MVYRQLSTTARRFAALAFTVVLAASAHFAQAAVPGRFAGSYELKNVVREGDQVHLTIALTVLNPGNNDVKGGIVALLDSQPHPELIGPFPAIKLLPHLGEVSITQDFTLSAAEYHNWLNGHEPIFRLLVASHEGDPEVHIQARRVLPVGLPLD